ncbi:MAG: RsmB/NOP family class I SAM-dependent RNA methyltransferase [Deltaproteobacteria bacterium]|nr:RsmB/NOP family class I SAM-dependent RNA methyltransferase [Deltaproteobacteria bacterium]
MLRLDPPSLHDAGRLYQAGLDVNRPLDAVVAAYLRDRMRGRPDPARAFVVDTAQGMWRRRRVLDAIAVVVGRSRAFAGVAPVELSVGAALLLDGALPTDLPWPKATGKDLQKVVVDVVARASLAVRASLPDWLCARLVERGGEALALSSTTAPPQTLRVNTLKIDRPGLIKALAEQGVIVRACGLSPVGVVVDKRSNVFRTAAFREGLFEVQDEGSQLVALLAGAKAGMRVVDGCAGAGGKTLALAAAMQNKGTLLALDVHGGRLHALRERTTRAGVDNVRVHDLDEEKKALKRLKGACDVVVVDAPCSGSGVLRRNPDTGWRLTVDDVARLTVLQADLLRRYAALVKPGGVLLYATCSLLDDENRAVVGGFLEGAPAFALVPARARLAGLGITIEGDDDDDGVLSLDPVRHGTDGFFAAVFRRAEATEAD